MVKENKKTSRYQNSWNCTNQSGYQER